MEVKYKEFSIITSAECDENSNLWNGRYRIMDGNGVVAYESFAEPCSDQKQAQDAAIKSAHEWVDTQQHTFI